MRTDKSSKVWTLNFFLLWQGQFVSAIGDNFYTIALGFWVLAQTGSSVLMSSIMAASFLPRALFAPLGGVLADRYNKKNIVIINDILRGIIVLLIALSAYFVYLQIWMLFTAAIIMGICGAFFSPAVVATIPLIVDKNSVNRANAAFNIIYCGSGLLGNSSGGFIFSIIGAPLLFLINGLSYIFSGLSVIFLKFSDIKSAPEKKNIIEDFKVGLNYVRHTKEIKLILISAAIFNFFWMAGYIPLMPFFDSIPGWGAKYYGILMAAFSIGMLIGYLVLSMIHIKPKTNYYIFMFSICIFSITSSVVPMLSSFYLMCIITFISGLLIAFIGNVIMTILQITSNEDNRGRVISFYILITQGLMPLGMVIGGLLGDIIGYRLTMVSCYILASSGFLFISFKKEFKEVFNIFPCK